MTVANSQAEIADLRRRLEEAEETIRAIRCGDVDAFVVEMPQGARVYTLQSADRPYRLLVEGMQQGALTLGDDGTIAYCNRRFADLVGVPPERLVGVAVRDFIPPEAHGFYEGLLRRGRAGFSQGESHIRNGAGEPVPVFLTLNSLPPDCGAAVGILVTDLTTQKHHDELRASEERYRNLFNSIDEGFCVVEMIFDESGRAVDYRFLEVNPTFARQTGLSGATGKRMRELVPDLEDHWFEIYGRVAVTGEPIRFVNEAKLMGGRWFDVYACRVGDHPSRKVALIFNDITERRQSEQKFRGLLESAPDAMVIIDGRGRIALVNAQTEKLFGYARGELVGMPVEILIPQRFHDRHPGHRQSFFGDPKLRPMGAGRELWAARRDGTEFQVEIGLSPLETESGVLVTAAIRDITERKKTEEALRASEAFSRDILENSPDCVKVLDAAGHVVGINANGQCLMEIDDIAAVEGRAWCDLWPDEGQTEVLAAIEAARSGGTGRFQRFCPTAKGTPKWWDVIVAPIRDAEGEVVRFISVSRDISERKQAELKLQEQTAALAEADRRKNEFLAMLAHELRNPLAPIRNAAQALQLAPDSADAVRSASAMIGRQVGQMVRLVDDLLDVSRVSRGKIDLRRERVELASAVNHAVEAALALYENRNHNLIVTMPPQPVYLNADPTRLAQVVGNLLNNACKFTDKGGRISLTVERGGEWATIRVRDSGIGIAADQLPRIFDLFTQIDTSIERSVSGLGIGLTLVKTLVEMHDGTVDVLSDGVGRGSEFVVRLPVMVEPPPPPPVPPAAAPATARRILVVDDNRDSATSLAMLLELTGNETTTAYDGLEAVEAAEAFRPDVVLLDIGLPKLNGYGVARKIREQPWGNTVVLVALTGWGQEEDRQKSRDGGFDAHMVKPVDFDDLLKVLAETRAGAPKGSAG